ncbi:MAG TPA: UDP-N-acetylmuramoyl-tripeptide--D-alanyl-D-alanine ligase [Solirubrobacteraceae bacterium]|nr:UDP-N-acetylmuramoyl-tripeptide--D-alanyl-D-alanine ligase [Solirubrobacteraceae bacterium]
MSVAITLLAVAVCLAGQLHLLLHAFQQEHYENARLYLWVRRDLPERLGLRFALVALLGAVGEWLTVGAAGVLGAALFFAFATWSRDQVKPLVFTARARRLFAVALLIALVPPVLAGLLLGPVAAAVAGALCVLGLAWLLSLANVVLRPYQRLETRRYVRSARRKLEQVRPLVVGISGSFGKTTTKACVAAALDPHGPAYPTPASFNSYLGVVRAINEGLEPRHETFVAELGSYRIGDIAELCELVEPTVGILTNLGPAHLERFGSMDAIEQAEGEVADALPEDGLFVTRADDERCRRVASDRARCRTLLFSPAPHEAADLWAESIAVASGGTDFEIRWRDDPEPLAVRSRLLGEPNVANLLAAAAVARDRGSTPAQIARALRRVAPPKHRLEPIVNQAAGIVVIDDSYNSNPIGAAAALGVLAAHEAGRRILVTPGMVELGPQEEEENRRLGELAAAVCDICLLAGPLAPHIRAGLVGAGFDEGGIIVAADGPAAHAELAKLSRRGDVILFENDLPDVYG